MSLEDVTVSKFHLSQTVVGSRFIKQSRKHDSNLPYQRILWGDYYCGLTPKMYLKLQFNLVIPIHWGRFLIHFLMYPIDISLLTRIGRIIVLLIWNRYNQVIVSFNKPADLSRGDSKTYNDLTDSGINDTDLVDDDIGSE